MSDTYHVPTTYYRTAGEILGYILISPIALILIVIFISSIIITFLFVGIFYLTVFPFYKNPKSELDQILRDANISNPKRHWDYDHQKIDK